MKAFYTLAMASVLASPALAEKINFGTVLTDQDNNPMLECADNPAPKTDAECKQRQPVTLGMITLRALAQPEQGLAADESLKRGQLGLRAYKAESIELTAEDLSVIKRQIAKIYNPLIVARTFPILDPATAK